MAKSKRRGNGEGSINWSESKQCFYAALRLGDGQRKYLYGKTRKEVQEKLDDLKRELQRGTVVDNKQTVEQFLDYWLEHIVKPQRRLRTYLNYCSAVRKHIVPAIGRVRLDKLTPRQVNTLLVSKQAAGLSTNTIIVIRSVLVTALSQAVEWHYVSQNVASLVKTPSGRPQREAVALDEDEARRLLHAAESSPYAVAYRLALLLSLRIGEVLALRWSDIDLTGAKLRVTATLFQRRRYPPKSASSRRELPLPPSLVAALREQQLRQGRRDLEYVFANDDGQPLYPSAFYQDFVVVLERAGLPSMRFHDLRHSCATLLAAEGVPPRTAMAILGHSDVRMTLKRYTHALERATTDAVTSLDRALEA